MTVMSPIRITDEIRREIELRAFLIWEREGRPHGRDEEHWRRAEAEVMAERLLFEETRAKPAKAAKPKAAAKKAETRTAAPKAAEPKAPAKAAAKSKSTAKPKTAKPPKGAA